MKTFNKVVVMFFIMMLSFVVTPVSHAATAPTFTPNIASGSIVEPGEQLKMVIKVTDDEAIGIQSCTYTWNDGARKSIFDAENLVGKEGKVGIINFTFEAFSAGEGDYTLKISATDDAGNSTGVKSYTYTVQDNDPPTITSSVANNSTVEAGSYVTVVIQDNDEIEEIKYSWNDEEIKTMYDNSTSGKAIYKYTY